MARDIAFDITPEKEASKLQFLRRQFSAPPAVVSRRDIDLAGKTAIVTGANGGIGIQCSRQLLDLGLGKLILAVRDEAKGEAIRKTLLDTETLEPGQTIEVWKLDYGSYESITAFAQRAEQLNPRLDLVLLNAGVNRGSFRLNPTTGHEEDLQTNYLSTVLLLLLMLDIFRKAHSAASTPGRIVVVSSDTAAWAAFREKDKTPLLKAFDDGTSKWEAVERYSTTKLLGQLFVTELAKRVSPALAVVNCANPGLCHGSGLARDLGPVAALVTRVVGHSSAVGARTLVCAATTQDDKSHGQYVEDGKVRPMAPFVYSKDAPQVAQRLWDETMEELSFAGVRDIIDRLGLTQE